MGVERFVVVTGYRAQELEAVLKTSPELLDVELKLLRCNDWQEGLALSLLSARDFIEGPFVLSMADHIFEDSLVEQMVSIDCLDDAVVALADLSWQELPELASAVTFALEGPRLRAAGRLLEQVAAVDCGIFAATPELFDALDKVVTDANAASELWAAIDGLARSNRVRVVETKGRRWFDVDTPASLIRAEMAFRDQWRSAAVQKNRSLRTKLACI